MVNVHIHLGVWCIDMMVIFLWYLHYQYLDTSQSMYQRNNPLILAEKYLLSTLNTLITYYLSYPRCLSALILFQYLIGYPL